MDYLADTSTHAASARPLSVKDLAEKAVNFEYYPLIPLRYWLRTADTLLKESNIYLAEGNDQQSYLLLLRYVELVLQRLPHHPHARTPEGRRNLKRANAKASEAIQTLEALKPRLNNRYERYNQELRAREIAARKRSDSIESVKSTLPTSLTIGSGSSSYSQGRSSRRPKPLELSRRMSSSSLNGPFSPTHPATPRTPRTPNGSLTDSRTLALEIARQEFEKRERAKRERRLEAALQSGNNVVLDSAGAEIRRIDTPGHAYHSGTGWGQQSIEEQRRRRREEEAEVADLTKSIQALQMIGPREERTSQQGGILGDYDFPGFPTSIQERSARDSEREQHVGSWQGAYPSVPKARYSPTKLAPTPDPFSPTPRTRTPTPPPKMPLLSEYPPPIPSKISEVPASTSMLPPPPPPPKPPKQPNTTSKEFSTPATLENGTPLRTVFLPSALRHTFLQIAAPNTSRNLETCGILCGTLIQNAFFISRLVIPAQTATSDTCAMEDEEGLFAYCDAEDLMQLGWIHTHPTQTCFMSSVDLHTHWGFQWQLPESVAIVCAPRHEPNWGVFRLTDPPGVKVIGECTQTGLFHPHSESEVYTDAMRPGHVCVVNEMGFDVVDLRKR